MWPSCGRMGRRRRRRRRRRQRRRRRRRRGGGGGDRGCGDMLSICAWWVPERGWGSGSKAKRGSAPSRISYGRSFSCATCPATTNSDYGRAGGVPVSAGGNPCGSKRMRGKDGRACNPSFEERGCQDPRSKIQDLSFLHVRRIPLRAPPAHSVVTLSSSSSSSSSSSLFNIRITLPSRSSSLATRVRIPQS